jgi:hypothetical protein
MTKYRHFRDEIFQFLWYASVPGAYPSIIKIKPTMLQSGFKELR